MNPKPRLLRLPQPVRYAMSAVRCLAGLEAGSFHLVGEVARMTGLSSSSLAKALQALARSGLLESRRGPRGGYRLSPGARDAALAALVDAAGPGLEAGECMVEARPCDRDRPCLLHPVVDACERLLRAELETRRLGELGRTK